MLLAAALLGVAIGLAVGAVGGGGAVLAVPVLVYLLDQPVGDATTSALAVVAGASLAGGLAHAARGRVCWQHTVAFVLPALGGTALGTAANAGVDERALLLGFVPIMVLAAGATWRRGRDPGADPYEGRACPPLRLGVDAVAGTLVGFLTGFFGVGGGFVIVPTLAVALHFPLRSAIGTSLIIVSTVSAAALAAHLAAGNTADVAVTIAMTLGCAAGAVGGARAAVRLPHAVLARGFAVLLVGVAVWLSISVLALGGP